MTTIVDLRTEGEVSQQPDVPVPGAKNVWVDILQGNSTAATLMNSGIVTVEEARSEMGRTYEQFVLGDDERRAFGRAITTVAASSGASIVHCTAGKDRTGWTAAILQLLAGVSEDDVVADYLLSQKNTQELTDAIMQYVRVKMPHQADAIEALMGVDEANIRLSLGARTRVRRYPPLSGRRRGEWRARWRTGAPPRPMARPAIAAERDGCSATAITRLSSVPPARYGPAMVTAKIMTTAATAAESRPVATPQERRRAASPPIVAAPSVQGAGGRPRRCSGAAGRMVVRGFGSGCGPGGPAARGLLYFRPYGARVSNLP